MGPIKAHSVTRGSFRRKFMKAKQRVLALLLSVMMIITYMPAIAFAEEADEAEGADVPEVTDVVQAEEEAAGEPADAEVPSESAEPEVQSEEPEEQVEETEPAGTLQEDGETAEPVEKTQAFEKKRVSAESALPDKNLADNDDLLMDFLYRELSEKTGQSGNMLKARGSSAGSRLSGIDSILYESLKGQITAFVDPEESATYETSVFDVPVAEILGKELTQTTINDGSDDIDVYEMSNEDFEAIQSYDGAAVVDALLADLPYELYWFDKTSEYFYGLEPTDYYVVDDCVYFEEEPGIRFTFKVAAGYSVTGKAGTTEFDTSKIQAVKVAVKRAANIIASTAAEGGSDYDKLVSYRESICDMTSYNDAAAQGGINYGDPWQMIYVFDGNAETEVVCEGYSKAFQYLCDNTDFSGDIECVSVTGTMEGGEGAGPHMWNVVTIDDVNYMVDVTNCDEGTVGADDQLFLAGWSDELHDTDDNVVGYRYTCNDGDDDVDYEFDEGQFMTMSDSAYDGEGGQTEEHEISYSTSHVFYEGLKGYGTNSDIYDDNGEFIGSDEYFVYDIDAFEGDVLTIDGESYTYDYGSYAFINDDNTERISRDDVVFSNGDQDNTHWTLDNGNDTEVSYTVNYLGNETTVTSTLSPKPELELTYTRGDTLTEIVDGVWEQAEDSEEKWFFYNETPLIGDVLTVNGTAYTYQEKRLYGDEYDHYSDWGFYNADMSEKLDESYFQIQAVPYQAESHWVLGDDEESKDFPIKVTYIDNSVDSFTTVVKNPVQTITYTRNSDFIENKGGYPWADEDGTYFMYNVGPEEGDVITINGDDEYVYRSHYYDEGGYPGFYNSDNAELENVYFSSNQYEEPWVIPEDETETTVTFTIQYMGHTVPVEAKLIKNPVTGISFTPVNEYAELTQGRDNDLDEDPEKFILPYFEEGDKLTVSYNNKADKTYVFNREEESFINTDDEEDWIYTWNDDGVSLYADQSEPWTVTEGDQYYEVFVRYEGCEALAKKVKILPNPIKSISFNRNGEGQMELIDGLDSYIDDIWGDTGEQIKYFSLGFKLGDRITVKTTDGETDVYEYKRTAEYGKVFANIDPDKDDYLDEDFMHFNAVPSQSPENPWEVNHTYDAVLSYMGITTNVKVNIVPNPVTNVKFERDGSGTLTLYEGVDGETDREWDVDEGEIEYFRYYFQGFKKGDSITVTKNGGMNKYVYREIYTDYDGYINAFVNINSDEDIIEADEVEDWDSNQSAESPWTVNTDGYYFVFRYFGFEFQVPVVIAPNPVSEIGFAREGYEAGEDIELTEGLDARINSDGGRNRFFEYYLRFKNGDTIKLTDSDNKTTNYDGVPYADDNDEIRYFENKETGDRISPDDIDQSSEQSFENQWMPGDGTHTIDLKYFARTTGVNVTIKENPVREISFARPDSDGPVELAENGDGYWDGYTFRYEIRFKEGDELNIKYAGDPDPVNVKYVATKYPGMGIVFEAEGSVPEGAEQSIDASAISFRHNCDYQLNVDEDEEARIMLMYQGMWTDVPVTVTGNQVESIEYIWSEGGDAVELTEGVDGGYSTYYEDEGDITVFEYWMPYVNGDILKVKYAGADDPVSYVYNSESGAFEATGTIPEGAPETIAEGDIEQASNQNKYNPWEVGSDHEIDLTYMGSQFTVPVTIVEHIVDPYDINRFEISFDESYLVNEEIETTPYPDYFYVVHSGTVLEPIAKDGAETLDPANLNIRFIEKEFDSTANQWVDKAGAEWSDEFPTVPGVYFCEVSGKDPYTGTYEGMLPLVRVANHDWGEEVVDPLTGVKTYTCTVCGETRSEYPEGIVAAGNCGIKGDNVKWTLDADGNLVVLGSGAMANGKDGNEYGNLIFGEYASSIKTVVVESGVTIVGDSAFLKCSNLETVELADTVTKLGDWAFMKDSKLESVKLPANLKIIDGAAFAHCTSLTEIDIPEGVTTIGLSAFHGCSNLTKAVLPDGVTSMEGYTFYGCSKLTEINIPKGITEIADHDYCLCSGLTQVTIPENIETIGERAFYGCRGLTSVSIPESVTTIDAGAFNVCSNLAEVTIPASVTEIGTNAFKNCAAGLVIRGVRGSTAETYANENNITFIGEGEPDPHSHVEGEAVIENEVAATCKAEGSYDEVVYCTICGEELSRTHKTTAKIAHTEEVIPAVEASCTETGLTAGKKCSVCGEILEAQTVIPAKGHTWGTATYTWDIPEYTEVTGTHSCTVCHVSETAVAKTASSEVTKAPTTKDKGEITYTSEVFAEVGFEVQTIKVDIDPLTVDQAIAQAADQTEDADGKASAAENSTNEGAISDAENSATQAAAFAAMAEEAAQAAFDSAKSVYDNLPEDASEADKQNALANYENAVTNLAVAKQLKAAASSAVAKSKKAAAKVAANKAAAAYNSANSAASSAAAEVFRKEAEAQAAIAAEKAGAADNASADAAKAVSDIGKLAEEIADVPVANTVEEAVEAAKTEANTSAGTASEASTAADTSSGNAKTSADKAKDAVNSKAKAEANAAKAAQAAAAAKAAEDARQGIPDSKIAKVKISKPKAAKKAVTAKWKKLTSKQIKKGKVKKYEIWVCPNKAFGASDTIMKEVSKSKSSGKVKVPKKGTYFVKVRAIRKVGGVKYVGKWSSPKKVK